MFWNLWLLFLNTDHSQLNHTHSIFWLIALIDAELKIPLKHPVSAHGADWEQRMPWDPTGYQLVLDGIPNASFHGTSPQQSQLQASNYLFWLSQCHKSRRIKGRSQKIFTFRIPLSGVPASYKLDEQSLCIFAFLCWQAQVFPGIYPCANAFTGFHKESSRLLQGFDTYGYVYPNRGTMLVLPKTECPWQCNSLKSKFGRNDKW